MIDSIKENITLGIIHAAISGTSIKVFQKNSGTSVPSGVGPPGLTSDAYDWMLKKCQVAQKTGVIKGILLHQGENDAGQSWWVDAVKGLFSDLKKDLGLGDIPIVVGELLTDPASSNASANTSHNKLIAQLASQVSNCGVASSSGLKLRTGDSYNEHFDCPSMRELGRRFAKALLQLAKPNYVPRKGTVEVANPAKPLVSASTVRSWTGDTKVFSLDGKTVAVLKSPKDANAWRAMQPGKVYLVSQKSPRDAKLMVMPGGRL